jgi:hypothetical protein
VIHRSFGALHIASRARFDFDKTKHVSIPADQIDLAATAGSLMSSAFVVAENSIGDAIQNPNCELRNPPKHAGIDCGPRARP